MNLSNTFHVIMNFSLYNYTLFLIVVLLVAILRYKIYSSRAGLLMSAISDYIIYFVSYNITLTILNKICWCTGGFNNLLIDKGQILNKDGSFFKQDIEIGTIEFRLPPVLLAESAINIFEKFVMDAGSGKTAAGYNAMRYSDCSTVQPSDLALNKVKFEVSLQSFYKQLDGYDSDFDGYVVIDNPQIGCYIDHNNGILTLNVGDLAEDNLLLSLVTKISITVFLKKAGWNYLSK